MYHGPRLVVPCLGMLTPYRRHQKGCPHRTKGAGYQRCSCPCWVDGTLAGRRIRRSLDTRDWTRALDRIRLIEASPERAQPATLLTVAIDRYFGDCRARALSPATLKSYRNTLGALSAFAGDKTALREIDEASVRAFRESRTVSPGTGRKELEYLRTFFAWCLGRKWIAENPAKMIRPPKQVSVGAVPFSEQELKKLFDAIDNFGRGALDLLVAARLRLRALMLLLLHSGLRIGDAAAVCRSRIDKKGYLAIRTEKTGATIKVKLGRDALGALAALPVGDRLFPGNSKTVVNSLQRSLGRLGNAADVHCHAHRFRDTFAVELLRAGADIRTVSLLLGHTSVRTTERHYAHFVSSHQVLLDRATARLKFKSA